VGLFSHKKDNLKESPEDTFPEPLTISGIASSTVGGEGNGINLNSQSHGGTLTTGQTEATLAELDAAIENGSVDLGHIVKARYLSQGESASRILEKARSEYAKRLAPLVTSYCRTWNIVATHYCTYIPAAVLLRKRRYYRRSFLDIEFVYFPEASRTTHPDIEAGLWKARSYYLDLNQCKSFQRRNAITSDIYFLIVNLLSLADAEAMDGYDQKRTEQAISKIDDELRQAKAEISRALTIEARHSYLTGTFIGAVVLGGGVVAIQSLVHTLAHINIDTLGLGAVIAGGIGAVLSVMTRLTANNLKVDPGVGRGLVLLAGSFRPLIGGIFAFAVYVFVQGGLLPIKVTVSGLQATYFFLGVAFLAGFSERFAQDAVTRAGSVIADTSPTEQSPRNSAEEAS
jgi:hypothetical protein